ncbi:MAG: hypothetical protein AAB295_09405 [Chloroflexota bacterium]
MSPASDWTVLFIGGPAAVGKTSAAKRIAVVSGATVLQADDVWLTLQRAVVSEDGADLSAFQERGVWTRSTKELVALKRRIAETVSASLEPVVANHLAHDDRLVIEGVWVTPEFATRTSYAGHAAGEGRRCVFVLEDDPVRIREAMLARGRGFDAWPPADRDAMAAMQAGYSRWLRAQALLRDAPTVDARPAVRLAERILAVL